jgi:hypothetical protein
VKLVARGRLVSRLSAANWRNNAHRVGQIEKSGVWLQGSIYRSGIAGSNARTKAASALQLLCPCCVHVWLFRKTCLVERMDEGAKIPLVMHGRVSAPESAGVRIEGRHGSIALLKGQLESPRTWFNGSEKSDTLVRQGSII